MGHCLKCRYGIFFLQQFYMTSLFLYLFSFKTCGTPWLGPWDCNTILLTSSKLLRRMNSTQDGFVVVSPKAWLNTHYNVLLKSWFDLVGFFLLKSKEIILKYHGVKSRSKEPGHQGKSHFPRITHDMCHFCIGL
jgi:hypothetical protein